MKTTIPCLAALCGAAALTAQTSMAQSVNVIERDGLRIHVFLSKPVIFQVASVVLECENEVALVDAQFSADNARGVVDLIRTTGKPLTTIFISHSDPDYYFGLGVIADAFPNAKILATPQTVWMIEATKEEKLAIWAPELGGLAPKRIVVPTALKGDHFMIGNLRVDVRQQEDDEQHAFLWIPTMRTILGGVYLSEGEHLWVADSPTRADREKWLAGLDAMTALNPSLVIPAHFVPSAVSSIMHQGGAQTSHQAVSATAPIDFTRRYLVTLESTLTASKSSADVISHMKVLFPNLAGESSLDMTARVLKGDREWSVVRAFPAIGRKVEVDFGGEFQFELDFADERTMTFRALKKREQGLATDTVQYKAVEVAPHVYMVYWTEKDKTNVVHVEDFGRGIVHTCISKPDGAFTTLRGTLRLVP
ncbi:MAG: MBL fold metallo-hydrolase [Alistipes sp.]|jgi:glyoxylase-like metal-dependent hydrolase (beta-lactamase superfamily II)|nr:MBL fold metallo-hydrolase [Alistipes sp.]